MAAYMFLTRNGLNFQSDEATVVTMTRSFAANEIDEVAYTTWLARRIGS